MKRQLGGFILAFMLVTGSAWADDAANKPQFSGFLSDYSKLQPAEDREGVWNSINKTADYSGYSKIMFAPVEVYLVPNPDYKGLQPDVLKQMTDNFQDSFTRALSPAYQIVNEPGPDVLTVRAAITGVQLVSPSLKATDLIPLKALFNLGRSATGNAPVVAELTGEMEVLDANGNRVAAAVATRKGDKTLSQGEKVTWDDLQAITDYWAKSFRERLDQLRGAGSKS